MIKKSRPISTVLQDIPLKKVVNDNKTYYIKILIIKKNGFKI